jgi:hypothetical protein
MHSNLILLDADGVMVDYHAGYAQAWERAFGEKLQVKDPQGHHPMHYWEVPLLDATGQAHLNEKGFNEEAWSTMPALPGAVEACRELQRIGFRLQCASALSPKWRDARAANLKALGFEMEDVHAVGHSSDTAAPGTPRLASNPKLQIVTTLAPRFFVDDHLPFFQGVPAGVWRALIDVRPNGSTNGDPTLESPHSRHQSLAEFAAWCKQRFV